MEGVLYPEIDFDCDRTRQFVQQHKRIKAPEKALVFAALDCYERVRNQVSLSKDQIAPLVAAAYASHISVWDVGCRAILALAKRHPIAQQEFVEMFNSPKGEHRDRVMWLLPHSFPTSLQTTLVERGLHDKNWRVRMHAAMKVERLELRQLLPALIKRASVESNKSAKGQMDHGAKLLSDGYYIEPSQDGFRFHVRQPDGWATKHISKAEAERGDLAARAKSAWDSPLSNW